MGQGSQAVRPVLDVVPAAQGVHSPPAIEICPAGQASQAVRSVLDVVPAAQFIQIVIRLEELLFLVEY